MKKYRARDFVSNYKYNGRNKNEKTTGRMETDWKQTSKSSDVKQKKNPENKMDTEFSRYSSNLKKKATDRERWMTKCNTTQFLEV